MHMTEAEAAEYAYDMPITDTCSACGADLELEPNVGWVDALSGDDGGTYDYCQDTPNREHTPRNHQ